MGGAVRIVDGLGVPGLGRPRRGVQRQHARRDGRGEETARQERDEHQAFTQTQP